MKALILDRDGVINKDLGRYLEKLSELEFIPGILESLSRLSQLGFKFFVASNQAGVGKGIVSRELVDSIEKKIQDYLKQEKAKIEKFYYCFHQDQDNCSCRKPKAGLLEMIKNDYPDIVCEKTYFVGDSERDMIAAESARFKKVLILTGKSKKRDVAEWTSQPDFIVNNFLEVEKIICEK